MISTDETLKTALGASRPLEKREGRLGVVGQRRLSEVEPLLPGCGKQRVDVARAELDIVVQEKDSLVAKKKVGTLREQASYRRGLGPRLKDRRVGQRVRPRSPRNS